MSDVVSREVAEQRYAHGTYARYKLARCRCAPCRFAVSEYNRRRSEARPPWRTHHAASVRHWVVRNRLTAEIALRTKDRAEAFRLRDRLNADLLEDPSDRIDAKTVRRHLRWLSSQGVGRRAVVAASGVGETTIQELRSGRQRHVLRGNAEKILSVGLSDAGGAAIIDAAHTWSLLDCLLSAGWPKARIARALGAKRPALQIRRDRVLARTARAVEELHRRAWWQDPRVREVCSHERARIRMEKREEVSA